MNNKTESDSPQGEGAMERGQLAPQKLLSYPTTEQLEQTSKTLTRQSHGGTIALPTAAADDDATKLVVGNPAALNPIESEEKPTEATKVSLEGTQYSIPVTELQQQRRLSQPGAYAVSPVSGEPSPGDALVEDGLAGGDSHSNVEMLVEANLVTDATASDVPLVPAQAILEKTLSARRRKRLILVFVIVASALIAIAVSLGVTLGLRSTSALEAVAGATSSASSPGPTGAPTAPPDYARIFEKARSQLPTSTLEALKDIDSVPSKAWAWLMDTWHNQEPLPEGNRVWRIHQRFAMACFYLSTGGGVSWSGGYWLSPTATECGWEGSTCKTNGKVSSIRRERVNMTGSLPRELGMLTAVTNLDLSYNAMGGTIPTELGLLTSLGSLQIDSNFVSGPIPTEMGEWSQLTYLDASTNQLSGGLPTQVGKLSNMYMLLLTTNNLLGPIPTELGLLTVMDGFSLARSPNLNGTIPTEIGQLSSKLTWVSLDLTSLSGSIPSELGRLTLLTSAHLDQTSLTGSVPSEVCNLVASGALEGFTVDCGEVQCCG